MVKERLSKEALQAISSAGAGSASGKDKTALDDVELGFSTGGMYIDFFRSF